MSRQSGYYWVKEDGLWVVAWYSSTLQAWQVAGSRSYWEDTAFDEINETRILAPDEGDIE